MKAISSTITKIQPRFFHYAICAVVCLALSLASTCGVAQAASTSRIEEYKAPEDIVEISKTLNDIYTDANNANNLGDFQNGAWPEEFADRLHEYDLRLSKSREVLAGRKIYSSRRKQAVDHLLVITQSLNQILQQWSDAAKNHDVDQYNDAIDRFNIVQTQYNTAANEYDSANFIEVYEYLRWLFNNPIVYGICAVLVAIALIGMVATAKIFRKTGYAGWKAFAPFYNAYIMCKISGLRAWCTVLFFIPIANLVIAALFAMKLAQKFGKSKAFGFWMLFVLAPIGQCLLAFRNNNAKCKDVKPKGGHVRPGYFGIWLRKIFSIPVSFVVVQTMMTLQYFFDNANEVTTGKILSFLEFAKIHPAVWLVPVLQVLSIAIFLRWRKLHDIIITSYFALGLFMSFAYYNDADTHLTGYRSILDGIVGFCLMYLVLYLLLRLVSFVRLFARRTKKRLNARNK